MFLPSQTNVPALFAKVLIKLVISGYHNNNIENYHVEAQDQSSDAESETEENNHNTFLII
jgi:hypothetical protein